MNETLVTVVGNVATEPEMHTTATGVGVTRFRLATTARRWDAAARRVDGRADELLHRARVAHARRTRQGVRRARRTAASSRGG